MRIVPDTKVEFDRRCSGMDGGWGMKEEFFEESMKVADRCVNDLNQRSRWCLFRLLSSKPSNKTGKQWKNKSKPPNFGVI